MVLTVVILLHIALLYGIQSGLARKVVELLPEDIQTEIIEEEKPKEEPPPPPPPDIPIEPPPFVPPPEVQIQVPVQQNTITQVTTQKPPVTAPPVMTPPAPPKDVIVNPRLDPKRAQRSLEEFYPASSKRAEEEGSVVVSVYVKGDGRIQEVKVDTSSGFPALDEGAVKYAKTWRLLPGTKNGIPQAMWYKVKVTFQLKK